MNYSRQAAGPKKHTRLTITYSALPGLLVLLVLASIAMGMSITVAVPAMMAAIVLGYAARYVAPEAMMNPGVLAGTGVILRLGVALLGLRISFSEIAALGLTGALAIPVIMGVTILTVTWLGAKFLKDWQFGLIAGASIAICGASAAMAMSAILPQTQRNQHSTLLIVVGVTTLSTIAMIVYPSLAVFMGLSSASSGLFLGGSIHDVAQVVGAGYAISDAAGDASVVVKLYLFVCRAL